MASIPTVLRGVVHGNTIELEQALGLPDGETVNVTIERLTQTDRRLPPGEGIRRAEGAWAEDAEELDKFLEWNRRQRKVSRPEVAE